MKILLGEKRSLEEVFASIDADEVKQRLKESRTDDKIPQKLKEIILKEDLPELIMNSFKKRLAMQQCQPSILLERYKLSGAEKTP